MKLAVIGHSMIALRQQLFFQELARQGHQVLVVSPGMWGKEKVDPYEAGSFRLVTCRHIGDNIYSFHLLGAKELIVDFKPDWLYVQQEAASSLARLGLDIAYHAGCKKALFVWENLRKPSLQDAEVLGSYDLVVCGNDDAERLVKEAPLLLTQAVTAVLTGRTQKGPPQTIILPQVGVDTDHFQARPIARDQRAIFVANEPPGTRRPEKGFDLAKRAWPTMGRLEFTPFRAMPWAYSQIQVVVCPSIDSTWWREQAMPYVAVEANSCFVPAVVSDAGSILYWHTRFAGTNPGVRIIPTGGLELREAGGKVVMASRSEAIPEGLALKMARDLADAIGELLGDEGKRVQMGKMGREWVVENLSNPVIARRLAEALGV